MGKTIEHKYRFVWVMVSSNAHKYDIPSKPLSLKGYAIFINEYLILEDQAKLRRFER
jgi:hypothetical protein